MPLGRGFPRRSPDTGPGHGELFPQNSYSHSLHRLSPLRLRSFLSRSPAVRTQEYSAQLFACTTCTTRTTPQHGHVHVPRCSSLLPLGRERVPHVLKSCVENDSVKVGHKIFPAYANYCSPSFLSFINTFIKRLDLHLVFVLTDSVFFYGGPLEFDVSSSLAQAPSH